jgi:hypothetical protein
MFTTGRAALDIICELASRACHADISCIVRCTGKTSGEIVGAKGTNTRLLRGTIAIESLNESYRPIVTFENLPAERWFKGHALEIVAPSAKRLVAVAIPTDEDAPSYLVLFSGAAKSLRFDSAMVSQLAILASAIMQEESSSDGPPFPNDAQFAERRIDFVQTNGEDAVLSFLSRTLIKRPTLKTRNGVAYLVIRRWKAQIKDAQIAAAQALKLSKDSVAAHLAADDIIESVGQTFKGLKFDAVVPIPCGNSGLERCLSVQIAERIAEKLNIELRNCLIGQGGNGASHPRKSDKVQPYKTQGAVIGNLLLVDDIVTSGKHLEYAQKTLSQSGAAVFAVAWIGV